MPSPDSWAYPLLFCFSVLCGLLGLILARERRWLPALPLLGLAAAFFFWPGSNEAFVAFRNAHPDRLMTAAVLTLVLGGLLSILIRRFMLNREVPG